MPIVYGSGGCFHRGMKRAEQAEPIPWDERPVTRPVPFEVFDTVIDAAEATNGALPERIAMTCNGKLAMHCNIRWRWTTEADFRRKKGLQNS